MNISIKCISTNFYDRSSFPLIFCNMPQYVLYRILCLQSKQKTPENPLSRFIQRFRHTCMFVTPYNYVIADQYLSPVVSTETRRRINLSHIQVPAHESWETRQCYNQRYSVVLCVHTQLFTAFVPFVGCYCCSLLAAALDGCCSCCPFSTELSYQ
jgi:hypothetical protein